MEYPALFGQAGSARLASAEN